jgi:hypothetical protein
MQASSQMIVWSALVDGVAFLVSGLLLAGTLMRSALGARRTWVRLLAALPVLVELLALVGLVTLLVLLFALQIGVWIAYLIWGITIWSSVSVFIPEGSSFLSSPFQDWQRAWEMNLFLLALPTAYVLWRWFLALFTKTALVTQQ